MGKTNNFDHSCIYLCRICIFSPIANLIKIFTLKLIFLSHLCTTSFVEFRDYFNGSKWKASVIGLWGFESDLPKGEGKEHKADPK